MGEWMGWCGFDRWAWVGNQLSSEAPSSTAPAGTYMPMSRIYQMEGGADDPNAWRIAQLYAAKCVQMGPPWSLWNPMTERTDYLYLEKSWSENLSECWSNYLTSSSKDESPAEASALETPPKNIAKLDPVAKQDAAKKDPDQDLVQSEGSKQPKRCIPADPGATPPQKKTALDVSLKALKIRNMFISINGAANMLENAITSGSESWSWANNATTLKSFKDAQLSVQSVLRPFGQQFVLGDPKSMKGSFDAEAWQKHLCEFILLETPLKDLQRAQKRLCAMQKAATAG